MLILAINMVSRKFLLALTPLAAAAVLGAPQPVQAILTFNIYESGADVVVMATGSLDLTGAIGTGLNGPCPSPAFIANIGCLATGVNSAAQLAYKISGPPKLPGTAIKFSGAVSGTYVALFTNSSPAPVIIVDSAYISGSSISSSATYATTTLAGLGLNTPGLIGTWTLDGTSENIYACVGPAFCGPPAPVPGPLPLFGAAAAFGYSRRLRRRVILSRPVSQSATSISV